MPNWTMVQALNQALAQELEQDERVLIFGEDVGLNGGVFRVTEGLQEQFGPRRVYDTPLAESALVGTALGMAIYGLRPVVEIQFAPFALVCFNQIATQAARMRYRSGGTYTAPLVIRAPFGGGVRPPEMHSDSVEAFFMHIQGLKVVIPATPYEAKGLLAAAIQDPDPVLFLEHMKLYRSVRQEVPAERYTLPLDQAEVVQEGRDLTLIAYGAMLPVAQEAAQQVADRSGASLEIINLRTIAPLDEATISASVRKTGRAVVIHEAARSGGVAAEVIAVINEQCLYSLLKPVARITGPDTPFPVPNLEEVIIPNANRVARAIEQTLAP